MREMGNEHGIYAFSESQEAALFEQGWITKGRTPVQKKTWGKDLNPSGQGVGPGIARPATPGKPVTAKPVKPKVVKPKVVTAKPHGLGHAPASGYSVKTIELVFSKEDAVTKEALIEDKFYIYAEDGVTKLAGPFDDEAAAEEAISKAAAEVAAEMTADEKKKLDEKNKTKAKPSFWKDANSSAEAKQRQLQQELSETYGGSGASVSPGWWITETYDDYVIASTGEGYCKLSYTIDAEGDVKFGTPTKVTQSWTAKAFSQKFWDMIKDAVGLPSWGAHLSPTTGGGVEGQASEAANRSTDNVSSGSHIVIQVAPGTDNTIGLKAVDSAEIADGSNNVQKYAIMKSTDAQRYTLGIAYPANRVDVHGDFMTETDLEKAAWAFFAKADSGVMHQNGTEKSGEVVESYIYRGPAFKSEDGTEVRPGDWMLGVVWGQPTWDRISKGELKGFSFQGFAKREKSAAPK